LLGHPDHSLINIQTTQTELLAFHLGFLKTKVTFYYENLVHILVNVPLFTSTAIHSVLCIKWFPKNEMVYSTPLTPMRSTINKPVVGTGHFCSTEPLWLSTRTSDTQK